MFPVEDLRNGSPNSPPPKRPRKELTLQDKVALIKESDGRSQRQLAKKYQIGKTQVGTILRQKRRYLDAFENNVPTGRKRSSLNVTYDEVDKIMWEWFQCKRIKFCQVSGPQLQAQAKIIALQLGHEDFKASNGWLFSFKQRHNIGGSLLSGEKPTVYIESVHEWKTQLCDITSDYEPKNIYSLDETSLVFHALPCHSLTADHGIDFAGGENAKDRITVLLVVNMIGEFDKPVIIGRDHTPRCFKNLTLDNLPFHWHANQKAWMTSNVFNVWLKDFNFRMKSQDRKVIVFLDNAFPHAYHSNGLSNVRLVFSPTETTALLQPLEQGIIENIKMCYRYRFLSHVLSQMDEDRSILEVSRSVSILEACEWVAAAVNGVEAETVQRCFRKAGFLVALSRKTDKSIEDGPPALLTILLGRLVGQLFEPITDPHEYVAVDASIPCSEELIDYWEDNFVSDWLLENRVPSDIAMIKEEIVESVVSSTPITSLKRALQNVRDQKQYATEMGLDNIYRHAVEMETEYIALLNTTDDKQNYLLL